MTHIMFTLCSMRTGRPLHLTYRYKLMPSRAQHRALERILEAQRLLYNAALQERVEAWRKAKRSITLYDQTKSLTVIRDDDGVGYGAMPVTLSRWSLKKVDEAFKAFFRRVKVRSDRAGFPRFRGRSRWRSFGFTEFSGIRLKDGRLRFAGLSIRMHMHRDIPASASIKSCVFTKEGRQWFVALQIAVEFDAVHGAAGEAVGIDWGVESFATLSTGETIDNPRLGRQAAAELRIAGRTLSRRKKGSKCREKAKRQLQRLQRRLADRRRTFLHRQSAELTRRFGMIAVENLQIANMSASARGSVEAPGRNVRQKAGLNREILDTSPGMFVAMLRYKAARAGGAFAAVDARGTSIECSGCGTSVPKDLSVRTHSCPHCDLRIGRDANAARVILGRAVAGPWSGYADFATDQSSMARRSGNLRAA
jgi:putative transposase